VSLVVGGALSRAERKVMMSYSVMRWVCLCAVVMFPLWTAVGCGGGDDGTGGSSGNGGTGGTAGTGGSAGAGGSGGGGGVPELTLEQQVVGGWTQSGSCDGTDIVVGKFFCPGPRIRGGISFDNFDFVVCGTWSAENPDDVTAQAQLISVQDPSDPANEDVLTLSYTYDSENDQLIYHANCDIPMVRVEGGVTADDCESSTCTAGGGSGPVQCTVDCDCGRCNYCESGTCRYGGEGEYGCYRGCGEYVP
jgi:hypothetical protein